MSTMPRKKIVPLYQKMFRRTASWYSQLYQRITLMGWVILGLGLIMLAVSLLARSPGWIGQVFFGDKADVFVEKVLPEISKGPGKAIFRIGVTEFDDFISITVPILVTLSLYIVLAWALPRFFPWTKRRGLYLLIVGGALFAVGCFLLPSLAIGPMNRFQYYLLVYALVAYARVKLSRKESWLTEALILIAVFLSMAVNNNNYSALSTIPLDKGALPDMEYTTIINPDQNNNTTLFYLPFLGTKIGGGIWLYHFWIWLAGFLCLHIYTGIGVHERKAREKSDALVQELTRVQEQLRAYALHAEELAIMRERTRVAREVHDTLAQGLAAIKMHLETGLRLFHEQPALARQHMERAGKLAGEHLSETRNSILNLRTDALTGRTLPSALASLATSHQASNLRDAKNSNVTFCVSGIKEDAPFWLTLPPAMELACYRITQEALSNAIKHGQAGQIDIELSLENDELCLTITDDGQGFDPLALHTGKNGFGLIGMHERLKLLNGRLEMISAPGAGAQVVAMIPLRSSERVGQADREEREYDSYLAR